MSIIFAEDITQQFIRKKAPDIKAICLLKKVLQKEKISVVVKMANIKLTDLAVISKAEKLKINDSKKMYIGGCHNAISFGCCSE